MASGQKRIGKELSDLTTSPPSGITVALVDESDILVWKATMQGPEDSPYAGGQFHLLLTLPSTYPFKPPTLSFLTKIYHPNVSNDVPATTGPSIKTASTSPAPPPPPPSRSSGSIMTPSTSQAAAAPPSTTGLMCLGPLRPDAWKPSTKISAILEFARQLLREPNPDDAVETRIAEEFKNDRKTFEKEAKEWTKRYAGKK